MMRTLVLSSAMFALADAMATPMEEGFERDVVNGATVRRLQGAAGGRGTGGSGNGGNRRGNDINICEAIPYYDDLIPVSQVTGTIHDDAVRGTAPTVFRTLPSLLDRDIVHNVCTAASLHNVSSSSVSAVQTSRDSSVGLALLLTLTMRGHRGAQTDRTDCSQGQCSGADTGMNG
jgi:hypothetical protein